MDAWVGTVAAYANVDDGGNGLVYMHVYGTFRPARRKARTQSLISTS